MTKNQPGTDITKEFLPFYKKEIKESLEAAQVDTDHLAELSYDESLYDKRLVDMSDRPNARVFLLKTKVRFTCPDPACKHTWTSGLGQFAAIIDQNKFFVVDD